MSKDVEKLQKENKKLKKALSSVQDNFNMRGNSKWKPLTINEQSMAKAMKKVGYEIS